MKAEALIQAALSAGAADAAVIPGERVVLNREFYEICRKNACGFFGRCWMCPPEIPPVEELMQRVRSFRHGLLYQTIAPLQDSFDIEGMSAAAMAHARVSQRIQENTAHLLQGNRLHLSCGGCNLCERCAKRDDAPCRFPDRALYPLEGAGVDVYNTSKNTQLKYINGANTVTYFGLLLFGEKKDA